MLCNAHGHTYTHVHFFKTFHTMSHTHKHKAYIQTVCELSLLHKLGPSSISLGYTETNLIITIINLVLPFLYNSCCTSSRWCYLTDIFTLCHNYNNCNITRHLTHAHTFVVAVAAIDSFCAFNKATVYGRQTYKLQTHTDCCIREIKHNIIKPPCLQQ